jgi:hypothetical protein
MNQGDDRTVKTSKGIVCETRGRGIREVRQRDEQGT